MDDDQLPPEPEKPLVGGIPDDDEFLNSLFRSTDTKPTAPLPAADRAGKARDRYQKRREKSPGLDIKAELEASQRAKAVPPDDPAGQTPVGRRIRPVAAVSQTQPVKRLKKSQVGVPGDFTLPKLDYKRLGIYAYIAAGLLVVIGVIVFLGLFKNDPAPTFPNAIWIGSEWTFEEPSDAEVNAFASRLRQNSIGTVYAWVSFLKGDGEWSGIASGTHTFEEVEPNVVRFVSQFREAYPQADLYGWVGFPVDVGGTYRLNDAETIKSVAEFSGRIVNDLGFDGVMLNAETVWNANADDFIALLQAVRREIGDAPLSVAVIPDWSPSGVNIPKPPQIAPGTAYSTEFKQRIALLADEIVVMAYNSDLSAPRDYIEWVAYQTQEYARSIAEIDGGAKVQMGIPTYADAPAHDTAVENIPSAISGVIAGLQQAGEAARVIEGVAIYASWETDEDEWRLFEQFWVRR